MNVNLELVYDRLLKPHTDIDRCTMRHLRISNNRQAFEFSSKSYCFTTIIHKCLNISIVSTIEIFSAGQIKVSSVN